MPPNAARTPRQPAPGEEEEDALRTLAGPRRRPRVDGSSHAEAVRGDEAAPQGGTTAASTEAATTTPVDPGAETAPPVSGDPTEIAASSKKVLEDTDAPPKRTRAS